MTLSLSQRTRSIAVCEVHPQKFGMHLHAAAQKLDRSRRHTREWSHCVRWSGLKITILNQEQKETACYETAWWVHMIDDQEYGAVDWFDDTHITPQFVILLHQCSLHPPSSHSLPPPPLTPPHFFGVTCNSVHAASSAADAGVFNAIYKTKANPISGWNGADACTMTGVTCTSSFQVNSLQIQDNSLTGKWRDKVTQFYHVHANSWRNPPPSIKLVFLYPHTKKAECVYVWTFKKHLHTTISALVYMCSKETCERREVRCTVYSCYNDSGRV